MYLQTLSLINFKNYAQAEISFTGKLICFLGNNGEGKTNLLDAVYYLAFCKSFFNSSDSQNIRTEEEFFAIDGEFESHGRPEKIYCAFKKGQKKSFKRNKKEYDRLADHIGLIPMVMISPYDSELIDGDSDLRRKFLNAVISQYDKRYLDELLRYNKLLLHRNNLLKHFQETGSFDKPLLDVYSIKLSDAASYIFNIRKTFIEAFLPVFHQYYKKISGSKELVVLNYESQLYKGELVTLLEESLEKDRNSGYTTQGIHKDDLIFRIAELPLKKFASQGQQKTFLLSLKLGEYDFLKQQKKVKPILLLDDIYDKLDDNRVTELMNIIADESFGQVFITDTSTKRLPAILSRYGEIVTSFNVKDGNVNLIQHGE